jgi:putative FmdB family regulatory protein
MPIYEYECKKCGHKFEGIARVADPLPTCPKVQEDGVTVCGCETKKLISATSFILQGGGWASDGYGGGK